MSKTDVIELVSEAFTKDSDGNMVATKTSRETFCNVFQIGAAAYWTAAEHGIRPDAEVQLRSIEYGGEHLAIFRGGEFTIERVNNTGEYTRLTLQRREDNG